jgi:hypothetical protein
MRVILEIMNDKSVRAAVRLAAACEVHNRGYGKPMQEISAQIGIGMEIAHLSTEKKIEALKQAMGAGAFEVTTLPEPEPEAKTIDLDEDERDIDTTGLSDRDIRTIARFAESE